MAPIPMDIMFLLILRAVQVEFVSSPIKKFTATGIETEDGEQKDLDLIFCATGTNRFPYPLYS